MGVAAVYGGSRPEVDLAFWIWPILQTLLQITKQQKSSGFHPNLLYKLTFHWEHHLIIWPTRTVDNNHDDDDTLIKTKSEIRDRPFIFRKGRS